MLMESVEPLLMELKEQWARRRPNSRKRTKREPGA